MANLIGFVTRAVNSLQFCYIYVSFSNYKLELAAIDINGNNYLTWVFYVEVHLDVTSFEKPFKKWNSTFNQEKEKVIIFFIVTVRN